MLVLSFLSIALKRLWNRLGLTLLLILSTTLAIGIIACVPIFAGAVSLRIMQQELDARTQRSNQPPIAVRIYAMGGNTRPVTIAEADEYGAWLGNLLSRELGLPIESVYQRIESPPYQLLPSERSGHYTQSLGSVHVTCLSDIAAHIAIEGQPLAGAGDGPVMDVWVEQRFADALALQLGEAYVLERSSTPHLDDLQVRVVGFWRPRDKAERWWYLAPEGQFHGALLTTRQQYEQHIYPRVTKRTAFASWYFVFEDRRVNLAKATHYIEGLDNVARQVAERLPGGSMDNAPTDELIRGQERKEALSLVLLGFSVPVVAIMVYFVGVLSALMVRFQNQEIAMFASRGSSRAQIILLTLVETVILLMVATPLGLLLGLYLAQLLGYSMSFLRFVPREPLPVYLVSLDWRLIAGAVLMTTLSRLIPAWTASKRTIVLQEQGSARRAVVLGMTRALLIAFLGLATWYAYRQLNQIGTLALVSWEPGDPQHDPLLLLAPSLFLLTTPLIACELFVWLARPLAWGGKWLRSVACYLGLIDLGREGGQYRTPIYMLVLCLSLGIFYASLAKSADNWLVDRRQFEVGSDLTFTTELDSDLESYGLSKEEIIEALGGPSALPIEAYESIEGVQEAMPVGQYRGSFRSGRLHSYVRLMAIDRIRFPDIAYYRRDYAQKNLGELMNRLGTVQNGVLLPQAFMERLQISEGDTINLNLTIDDETRHALELEVVGTFDYFPTWVDDDEIVWVVNLSHIDLATSNMLPYGIWMRLEPGVTAHEVLEEVRNRYKLKTGFVGDLRGKVGEDQAKLERVGIFGMLSVCFLAGALFSALGLLVHSAASMKRRSLRFAVLQALGMTRYTLLGTIFVEYLVTLLYGILAGAGLGILTSRLYGPFFQLTNQKTVPIPPYLPLVDQERAMLLGMSMGLVLIVIEITLFVALLRTKVFETLRLGMRE